MATIEIKRVITEIFSIPNCFCGNEPVVCTRRAQGNDCSKQVVWIECPYCHADSPRAKSFDANSINSRYEATKQVADSWCRLIEGRMK